MRYVVSIVAMLVVVGVLVGIKGAQIGQLIGFGKQMAKDGPPPDLVSASAAEEQSWEGTIPSIGNVASGKGVSLSTDTPGVVTRIRFDSGETVKQGQVLVELDTSVERAQLATAVSRRALATQNMSRTRALEGKGVLSPAQIDQDESLARTAATEVEGIEAQIAKKTIRAPFAGKLGIRAVNVGQFLNPGTGVTTLETTESMHVDFSLPQQRLSELKIGMPVRIEGEDGADAGAQVINGSIGAIDPSVDPVTRAIKLRADVPEGAAAALRPGMFVGVAVVLPAKATFVVVPATSVIHAPYGDSVFVVEDKAPGSPGLDTTADGKKIQVARQQFVKIGASRGDFVAVLDGVKAKQQIVSAGAFKLRNNGPIVLDPSKRTTPSLDPHPVNR